MSTYDSFAATFARSRQHMRWADIDSLLDTCQSILGAEFINACILDAGCGGGRFLGMLRERGHKGVYIGIDESSEMIAEAKARYPDADFRVLDMRSIQILAARFDLVFFIASFHHLSSRADRLATLWATKDILARNGLIGMTNWNLRDPRIGGKYKVSNPDTHDYDIVIGSHIRYYHGFDLAELAELFRETEYHTIRNETGERNIVSLVWNFSSGEYTVGQ